MKRKSVTFRMTNGEYRTIYQDEDPSGYFLMAQGPTAPMHGLDSRSSDDDFNHTETYDYD